MKRVVVATLLTLCVVCSERSTAQVCSDAVVMLSATVSQSPDRVVLHWIADTGTVSLICSRRIPGGSWGPNKVLTKKDTMFTDTTVVAGTEYEYRFTRNTRRSGSTFSAIGYIRTGVNVRIGDDPGGCMLLVDTTYAAYFSNELARLEDDLRAEGYVVRRVDVSEKDSVPTIKNRLNDIYSADPDHITTLFIFGHVPVPYSGFINPDGHPDHFGAWPADVYYGEYDGDWTDDYIDTSTARRPANHNVAGDGKFDQSQLPDDVNVEIGRVDLSDMPAFTKTEKELLKQYLDKDHAYRTGALSAAERALIDDNFGFFGGEAFASSGWRNYAPLVGLDSIHEIDWFTTLPTLPYLYAYGCGGGWDQGSSGVGATTDFAAKDSRAIFTMLFGSYFGDWGTQNNFLRAPLCTSYGLTCAWSGRPYWDIFPMGMGHSTGETAFLTENNSGTYVANFANYWVHVELMGDPTLRVRPYVAPKGVTLSSDHQANTVTLVWATDPEMLGYNVYRSSVHWNHFELLTPSPVTATTFTDTNPLADSAYYLVRGVRSETTKSGNYLNLAHGATAMSAGGFPDAVAPNPASADRISVIYPEAGRVATILVDLGNASNISVDIVDVQGRTVASLVSGAYSSGHYSFDWNFNAVADGLYFVRVSGTATPLTSKILVVKD